MKELKNGIKIIGIDHGYGNIKTAGTVTPTGITPSSTEPVFAGNILHYDGMYYRMGEGHKEFIPDKVQDNDFYLFTLMAIARELSQFGIREADVHIAAGLPLTWVKAQRESFRTYLTRNPEVRFTFRDKEYHIRIVGCSVFPQGYTAVVDRLSEMTGVNMLADIGNGTMNIMYINNKKPVESKCYTEKLGVNQCMIAAKNAVLDSLGAKIDEVTELRPRRRFGYRRSVPNGSFHFRFNPFFRFGRVGRGKRFVTLQIGFINRYRCFAVADKTSEFHAVFVKGIGDFLRLIRRHFYEKLVGNIPKRRVADHRPFGIFGSVLCSSEYVGKFLNSLPMYFFGYALTEVTFDENASFITVGALDENSVGEMEQLLDYAVENDSEEINVRAERYSVGDADTEPKDATPEQVSYIQSHRDEVISRAVPIDTQHFKVEVDKESVAARKAEILESSSRNQDKFISSLENSEKLLPLLNANRDFHSARLKTLNQKNATRTDKIERNEAKIERLTAKIEKLQAANEMLSSLFGGKAAPIRALIERNNARAEKIKDVKIPKREDKINKQLGKIERANKKIEREQCAVDKLENLSKAIGSFGILNGQER